jgi:hypothetical protein
MRALIVVVLVALGIIFVGGSLSVGGAPIFHHIDSLLRTNFLMKVHYTTFYFLYRGEQRVFDGVSRTKTEIEEFQQRPVGIDKAGTRQKLDDAAK